MMNSAVQTQSRVIDDSVVLTLSGTLDSVSYLGLRDAIIKAALDYPRALIVDINDLHTPADSALAVFTSARWHISRWPAVPLLLVCRDSDGRNRLQRNGITRYVPVHPTLSDALDAVFDRSQPAHEGRRRERASLPASPASAALARDLVTEWLTDSPAEDRLAAAKIVATVFVENALRYADGGPILRLEIMNGHVTIAVEDHSTALPEIEADGSGGRHLSGLKIVDALCTMWGCNPVPNGKAVWGVVAPEEPTAGR